MTFHNPLIPPSCSVSPEDPHPTFEPVLTNEPEPDRSTSAPSPGPSPASSTEPLALVPDAPRTPPVKKYLVGVLYYGPVDRDHDRSVKALYKNPFVYDVFELLGCPYIDIGRSIIATSALDNPEVGGVLFIDHDMVFEASEAEKVIESAEACQGTAGAAYSMRRPGKIIGGIDTTKMEPGKKVVFFQGGELLPAQYLGMGMTAIHRSVLERLVQASERRHAQQQAHLAELQALLAETFNPDRYCTIFNERHTVLPQKPERALELLAALVPELKLPDLPRLTSGITEAPVVPFFSLLQRLVPNLPNRTEGYYFGEDVSFCIRSHENELPVTLDTRSRVFHKGSYCYGLEDVGMQVPWCDRLEAVDTGDRDPETKQAWFSPDPQVREALRTAGLAGPETLRPAVPEAPPELLPESFDPTVHGAGSRHELDPALPVAGGY